MPVMRWLPILIFMFMITKSYQDRPRNLRESATRNAVSNWETQRDFQNFLSKYLDRKTNFQKYTKSKNPEMTFGNTRNSNRIVNKSKQKQRVTYKKYRHNGGNYSPNSVHSLKPVSHRHYSERYGKSKMSDRQRYLNAKMIPRQFESLPNNYQYVGKNPYQYWYKKARLNELKSKRFDKQYAVKNLRKPKRKIHHRVSYTPKYGHRLFQARHIVNADHIKVKEEPQLKSSKNGHDNPRNTSSLFFSQQITINLNDPKTYFKKLLQNLCKHIKPQIVKENPNKSIKQLSKENTNNDYVSEATLHESSELAKKGKSTETTIVTTISPPNGEWNTMEDITMEKPNSKFVDSTQQKKPDDLYYPSEETAENLNDLTKEKEEMSEDVSRGKTTEVAIHPRDSEENNYDSEEHLNSTVSIKNKITENNNKGLEDSTHENNSEELSNLSKFSDEDLSNFKIEKEETTTNRNINDKSDELTAETSREIYPEEKFNHSKLPKAKGESSQAPKEKSVTREIVPKQTIEDNNENSAEIFDDWHDNFLKESAEEEMKTNGKKHHSDVTEDHLFDITKEKKDSTKSGTKIDEISAPGTRERVSEDNVIQPHTYYIASSAMEDVTAEKSFDTDSANSTNNNEHRRPSKVNYAPSKKNTAIVSGDRDFEEYIYNSEEHFNSKVTNKDLTTVKPVKERTEGIRYITDERNKLPNESDSITGVARERKTNKFDHHKVSAQDSFDKMEEVSTTPTTEDFIELTREATEETREYPSKVTPKEISDIKKDNEESPKVIQRKKSVQITPKVTQGRNTKEKSQQPKDRNKFKPTANKNKKKIKDVTREQTDEEDSPLPNDTFDELIKKETFEVSEEVSKKNIGEQSIEVTRGEHLSKEYTNSKLKSSEITAEKPAEVNRETSSKEIINSQMIAENKNNNNGEAKPQKSYNNNIDKDYNPKFNQILSLLKAYLIKSQNPDKYKIATIIITIRNNRPKFDMNILYKHLLKHLGRRPDGKHNINWDVIIKDLFDSKLFRMNKPQKYNKILSLLKTYMITSQPSDRNKIAHIIFFIKKHNNKFNNEYLYKYLLTHLDALKNNKIIWNKILNDLNNSEKMRTNNLGPKKFIYGPNKNYDPTKESDYKRKFRKLVSLLKTYMLLSQQPDRYKIAHIMILVQHKKTKANIDFLYKYLSNHLGRRTFGLVNWDGIINVLGDSNHRQHGHLRIKLPMVSPSIELNKQVLNTKSKIALNIKAGGHNHYSSDTNQLPVHSVKESHSPDESKYYFLLLQQIKSKQPDLSKIYEILAEMQKTKENIDPKLLLILRTYFLDLAKIKSTQETTSDCDELVNLRYNKTRNNLLMNLSAYITVARRTGHAGVYYRSDNDGLIELLQLIRSDALMKKHPCFDVKNRRWRYI